jgi:hypothetical protein
MGGGATGGTEGAAASSSPPVDERRPPTIDEAPKITKQPKMTVSPRLMSTRPASISIPTQDTATIATVVAIVPSKVPSSHDTAATRTLAPPGGLESDPKSDA